MKRSNRKTNERQVKRCMLIDLCPYTRLLYL